MREDRYCEVCGRPYAELHHIIHRSAAAYLTNIPINFKYLCGEHHRGNNSPHSSHKVDRQYKAELQMKLEVMFTKDYYSEEELKQILGISKSEIKKLTKKMLIHKEGYRREDIILRLLGGRYYAGLDK